MLTKASFADLRSCKFLLHEIDGGVGAHYKKEVLETRNLLSLRCARYAKNACSARCWYTIGKCDGVILWASSSVISLLLF
jgi:hypothetical protein